MDPTKTQPLPNLAAPTEAPPAGAAPKLVLNFGHPLSDKAKEEIQKTIGPHVVAQVKMHLDLNAPVSEQVVNLCRFAVQAYGQPDYIILPGLALAAVYVDRFFSRAEDDFPPCITYTPIIRLVMIGQAPPVFTFGGVE
jgi:hypothetical protein